MSASRGVKAAIHPYLVLCAVAALLAVGMLVYSQTYSFADDEGFHVLAAYLIGTGKRPYLDFVFPQTPLNAYWNAAWMRLIAESWRVPHAIAALEVGAAVMLAADHVYRRFPDPAWRLAAALTTALCFGLNGLVVTFGTLAQAYGLCLLLIVCALRCGIAAVERTDPLWAASTGLFAGAAAASSLLTAPVAPVLLVWLLWHSPAGGRPARLLAFAAGAIIALSPLLWLFVQGPRLVIFNVLTFNALFRQVGWPGADTQNIEVYSAWIDSGYALVLGGLAAAALALAAPTLRFRELRPQFVLCGTLAAAQAAYLCCIIPTFERYFLLVVPFLAILAPAGLYALAGTQRRLAPLAAVAVFLALATAKLLFDQREDYRWTDAEGIAAQVDAVTPPDGQIFAEERIYFLAHRLPPSGLEHADALKLSLGASTNDMMHLMPIEEVARRMRAGQFATVEVCDDQVNEAFEAEQLFVDELYAESREFDDCTVYWNWSPGHSADAGARSKRRRDPAGPSGATRYARVHPAD